MKLVKWEELPEEMKTPQVRKYYEILKKKRVSLAAKRGFDIAASSAMLIMLSPVFAALAVAIKADSEGPVFFRQERVTQYGRRFRIFKFRTMVNNADKLGTQVTVGNDKRITKVGNYIRKFRLDEICQLIDVFRGTMTFVGTRPEVPRYVERYTPEMMATLLLPAGVTSQASICYKDEAELLESSQDADKTYVEKILPEKMKYNLRAIKDFSLFNEAMVLVDTVLAVAGVDVSKKYDRAVRRRRKADV